VATGTVSHDIFERHLDLAPLRGRRRGLVVCPFHRDGTPSLSVDLDAAIFHCFGCGEQGGRNRFAELIGESHAGGHSRPRPTESLLQQARGAVLQIARRQAGARPEVQLAYAFADRVRMSLRAVRSLRELATVTDGEEQRWQVLASAARIERLADTLEMELDEILLLGRYP
jgi:CHC2 zinc finger